LVYILEIKKNHPIDIEPYVEIDLWWIQINISW
jgi:hypothetical protein